MARISRIEISRRSGRVKLDLGCRSKVRATPPVLNPSLATTIARFFPDRDVANDPGSR
jgi:hypothetical protein